MTKGNYKIKAVLETDRQQFNWKIVTLVSFSTLIYVQSRIPTFADWLKSTKMSRRDDDRGGRGGGPPPDITKMVSLKVDGLSHRTSIDDLESLFEKYGRIGDVYIPKDYRTKESRGFGFVRFYSKWVNMEFKYCCTYYISFSGMMPRTRLTRWMDASTTAGSWVFSTQGGSSEMRELFLQYYIFTLR